MRTIRGYFSIVFLFILERTSAEEVSCSLPFVGKWSEKSKELTISDHHWGTFGACEQRIGDDQYLFRSNTSRYTCYRCLIVFPVHENILQFKSTPCIIDNEMNIEKCRSKFRGDAPLNTIFKADASPVQCPLDAPLNFTYSTSHGTCSSRTSTIRQCSFDKRLRIQYEACPELPHMEARGDEIECVGVWHSLGAQFFAARMVGKKHTHRCFIIDRSGSSGRIGVSADSSCHELSHLRAATTTLHYRQDSKIEPSCEFPLFLSKHSGGGGHSWHSVVTSQRIKIHRGEWTNTFRGRTESTMICLSKKDLGHSHYIRVYITKGCTSGYMCLKIIHKHRHVAHLSMDDISPIEYSECDELKEKHRDTIVMHGTQGLCPLHGRHYLPSCPLPLIESGCEMEGQIKVRTKCEEEQNEYFDCLAHWTEASVTYSILKHPHSLKMFCHVHSGNIYRMYSTLSCDAHSVLTNAPTSLVNITNSERCHNSLLAGFLSSSCVSSDLSIFSLLFFLISCKNCFFESVFL